MRIKRTYAGVMMMMRMKRNTTEDCNKAIVTMTQDLSGGKKERNMTQNDIRSEKDMTIEDVAVMMMMVIMVAGVQIGEKGKNVDLTEEGKIHLQMMRGVTIAIQLRKKVNMMREENSQNKKDQQRRLKSQKRLYERRQIQIIHS